MKGQFGMTFISSGTVDFCYFHKALYFLAPEKAVLTWMKSILTTKNSYSTDSLTCIKWDQNRSSIVDLHKTLPSHQAKKGEQKNWGKGEGVRERKEINVIATG